MGKTKYLLFIVFIFLSFLLSPQKVRAAELPALPKVVITEVMYDPDGSDTTNHEWVEIYNLGDVAVEITGWKFNDGSNHNLKIPDGESSIWIDAGKYLILADDSETFLNNHQTFGSLVIDTVIGLDNTTDTVSLIDKDSNIIDKLTYQNTWGAHDNGQTLEKIDFVALNDQVNWQESYVLGGTPGALNSEFIMPDYPEEVFELVDFENALIKSAKVTSIIDGDTIKVSGLGGGLSSTIRFLAVDSAETGESLFEPAKDFTSMLNGETIDLIISQVENEQLDRYGRTLAVVIYKNQVFNTQLLERGLASYYDTDNLVLKNLAWQAIEEQAQSKKIGLWASTASGSVILSELLPNPLGSDDEEWIEIYNPLDEDMDLSYFLIEEYLIPYRTIISPKSWLIFPRSQTGITLNNSGDTLKLFFPDGILADEVIYGKVSEGLSWALDSGIWSWTTTLTPGNINVITAVATEDENDEDNIADENIPTNTTPVEIKTGEVPNYENYLVKVTGTIVETSGNTFYIDDGSGRAKIYIQEATGIDKPPMHKGDIFEIVGIVNFYRGVWRILPQNQEDIKLIRALSSVQDEEAKSSIKVASAKSSTAKKSIASTTKSRSPTTQKVAGADNNQDMQTKIQAYQSPFWVQMTKAFAGLSIILLILLVVKVVQLRRNNPWWTKPLGGDFGDDT